ncbi:4-hydroxythreonine-4-phosphate dehydrogenase OS=Castellaniella defragrans OX=75697 GN=pdxA PE=3 SV=1 [Castellaniella defragrans]
MLGDMTGIGPEICARLLDSGRLHDVARVVVVGDARVFEMGCGDARVQPRVRTYRAVAEVDWTDPQIPLIDLGNIDPSGIRRGQVSPESGRLTGDTLRELVVRALSGEIEAVCFAPLNKAALHQGGWNFNDEHQLFAHLTSHQGFFGEMNVIPEFATFRVTSHVALRDALALMTKERVMAAIALAHASLQQLHPERMRIAVAALNPHAGEGGLFGDEEIRIIGPAIEASRAAGIDCVGPFPADTLFLRAKQGEFDGVVTMYHDQGQIATKLLGFHRGVTVTAGLSTVFATPAHGTAFDIVGRGVADVGALEQALRIAAAMAVSRRRMRGRQAACEARSSGSPV